MFSFRLSFTPVIFGKTLMALEDYAMLRFSPVNRIHFLGLQVKTVTLPFDPAVNL